MEAICTAVGDWIVESAVELLLVLLGSLVVAVTVAVLLDCVVELKVPAVTLMVMIATPPTLSVPILQVTVGAVYEHVPWLVELET
jgi:hypothetical protein